MDDRTTPDELIRTLQSKSVADRAKAALELGKFPVMAAESALIGALSDIDAGVRARAAFSLRRIGSDKAVNDLIARVLDREETIEVRAQSAHALGSIGSKHALPALIDTLHSESEELRQMVCIALGELGDPSAIEPLHNLCRSQSWKTRWDAVSALHSLGASCACPCLRELIQDSEISDDLKANIPRMLEDLTCS